MRLLIDMNLSPRWAAFLCDAKFEAIHWSDIGALDAPDTVIMAFARDNGFIVLTNDLDFGAILAATRGDKPSVVQIRADDVGLLAIGTMVIDALRQLTDALEEGALMTIDTNRTRVRLLPLKPKNS